MLRRSLLATLAALPLAASCASGGSSGSGQRPTWQKTDLATPISQRRDLSILWALVQAASFEESLKGNGPLTFFAPNNNAFDKVDKGTLDRLMRRSNQAKVREMLGNHLSNALLRAEDLQRTKMVYMSTEASFPVRRRGQDLSIGPARLVVADIGGGNGVIQIIDTPLWVPRI